MRTKIIITFFVIVSCVLRINAQYESDCSIPSILDTVYKRDIKHLALQRIYDVNSIYRDSIIIPESFQDTIWEGLAAIFNLRIPERDSIFNKYCIHHHNSLIRRSIWIGVNPNYSWTSEWKNLNTLTGVDLLDSLLTKYDFEIVHFSEAIGYATLRTSQDINVNPLFEILETVDGIKYAEADPGGGDGNRITYKKNGNSKYYNFTIAYGDCPSGCSQSHTFKFKVENNCMVEYLGSSHGYIDPAFQFPSPKNCNISVDIINHEIENILYPNPAKDHLRINSNLFKIDNYEIVNQYGQLIKTGKLVENNEISIMNLESGMYILRGYDMKKKNIMTFKFVKH